MITLFFLFTIYVALGLLLAMEGKKKKIGFFPTFLLSILLTPLVSIFFVMFSKRSYPRRTRKKDYDFDV
jgi:hypothetical protein